MMCRAGVTHIKITLSGLFWEQGQDILRKHIVESLCVIDIHRLGRSILTIEDHDILGGVDLDKDRKPLTVSEDIDVVSISEVLIPLEKEVDGRLCVRSPDQNADRFEATILKSVEHIVGRAIGLEEYGVVILIKQFPLVETFHLLFRVAPLNARLGVEVILGLNDDLGAGFTAFRVDSHNIGLSDMAPREKPIVIDGGDKLVIDRPREGPAVIGGHLLIVTLVEGDRLRGQFERRVVVIVV